MAKKGRRSARVHARAARAAQAEEADRCHPCAGQPQPEAEAVECSTCCYPFSKQDLFGCDTAQCDYIQCKDCIIKGRSGLCKHAGCVIMHWTCPACTNHVGDESKALMNDKACDHRHSTPASPAGLVSLPPSLQHHVEPASPSPTMQPVQSYHPVSRAYRALQSAQCECAGAAPVP